MIYDYAIIGAGISGPICAYLLAKIGKKCIIFERNDTPHEKTCGGGISYKALERLDQIGIDSSSLFTKNSKIIEGHVININGEISKVKIYGEGKKSLGIQRIEFDTYLLDYALKMGVSIIYGENVKDVVESENGFIVGNILTKDIIWATGANGLCNLSHNEQSIGYSGQICAKSNLPPNLFHYWYYDHENSAKYFWVFPIGNDLWNVGIWSRFPFKTMKDEYNSCLDRFFVSSLDGEWEYYRHPRAEFLGHVDQRQNNKCFRNGIGDFVGKCNPKNGGGIIGAIDSAIELVQLIVNNACKN